jgi:hypothetical protein
MTTPSDGHLLFASNPVALLLGAMVMVVASFGPAVAEGQRQPGTILGVSLPVGMTGPATASHDRLHTVPRLPFGNDDRADAPARIDPSGPALPGTPDAGIVTVRQ